MMRTKNKDTQQTIPFEKGNLVNLEQKTSKTIQFYTNEDIRRKQITDNILKYTKSF